MKLSINQTELSNALSIVAKGASTRSIFPILSGVLMKAYENTLTLETTNGNSSIRCQVPAFIEEEGETVVPSKLFLDVVKSLPDSAVNLETGAEQIVILCNSSSFSIRTLMAEDFPNFPDVSPETSVTLPFEMFSEMAKRVSKVVSKDESRAILTGVLVEVEDDLFRMVATDSYRLAFTETRLVEAGGNFSAVVAGSFLSSVASLGTKEQNVDFEVAENQIIIRCGSTTFVNSRIEGTFPRYAQLLPDEHSSAVRYDVRELTAAVKRISLLNDKGNPVKFDVNTASQTTQLSTSSQDVGTANETITSTIEGDDVVIGFNPSYVLDGLNSVPSDDVVMELQSSVRPGILKTDSYYSAAEVGKERFAYVIMPVRLS